MGENLATKSPDGNTGVYPAFRENTIESFQEAAKCGVGFVEFDVQVTRDNVPVIWHDDDVVIGPADHPSRPQVKDLTLAELKALSSSCECMFGGSAVINPAVVRRYEQWNCDQDGAIPTLEAVFAALPPEIGFDIEVGQTGWWGRCGWSMVHLADGDGAAAAPPPRRRRIIFSSFDPDVCVELRRRQVDHPVYYLSGCGLYAHADARRTSIPAALSFAAETGMQGIVLPASVLLKNMDMVESANRSHLQLMTYGLENNDLDCLKAQADAGVVAAIVDEVAGVTAALHADRNDDTTTATTTTNAHDVADAVAEGNDSGSGL
ncbi:hypothetical protein VOLCADRAFT_60393 [Volvox carteri f. nagariensis]|uniref:glycerophosphodiester phosphodiesterase n=1 Tax=Volvox carteri f. nagariensis TaxID=3068 RepID=D8TV11_VOLCA|nr:uncharacterized protein VOLCADRAFT_60393 [Volvox carteri f. nagariensis]EFJ48622.1 hypothetical protein VOLCADRAFT_60393 [Volvox carteri f. nagariensis]|eukprot:XP_002950421.1 hypothetical protein VOLCADRAFT_60393 [Volvox carteri f. nagariensis]